MISFPSQRPGPARSPLPPLTAATQPTTLPRRNADVTGTDRQQLVIDAGPRSIGGANVNRTGGDMRYAFEGGRFFGQPVALGELRTDEAGRLLVLGGTGVSGSRSK